MEYMRFKQIPEELQNRVIMYYEQRYRRSFFNEDQILANVSDVLRRELLVYNCRHLVDQVPLFKGVPQAVMQSIVARLKFEVGYDLKSEIFNLNTSLIVAHEVLFLGVPPTRCYSQCWYCWRCHVLY